uniref:DUF3455 domain-containing protein n=1 Tax=Paractinoplanes polyasparticus TaxID=2856853 RepID=UPI001C841791|nr:DUF3455 domain-containing protein [Actinoplanes polyasparticus]
MAVVVAAIGAVTFQASADEVSGLQAKAVGPQTEAVGQQAEAVGPEAEAAGPPAVGPGARRIGVPRIPSSIRPPAGSRLVGAYIVTTGTQTYTCTGGVFTGASAPEARLVGTAGWIHHTVGPKWQSERDKSLITATKTAESPREGTIPELLLTVNSHSGKGILSNVSYISRLYTSGGVAPAGSCTDGATKAVPYKALYAFWAAKRK